MLPPSNTHVLCGFTTKDTVSCCFAADAKHLPHRSMFCMIPPAGKVLVHVLFLLLQVVFVFVSVFTISFAGIIRNTITFTGTVPATINASMIIFVT